MTVSAFKSFNYYMKEINMILDKINFPKDLKELNITQLNELASEIRDLIIKKVNTTGGHMGPNLGIIEATIAMHYVRLYLMYHINVTRIKY